MDWQERPLSAQFSDRQQSPNVPHGWKVLRIGTGSEDITEYYRDYEPANLHLVKLG
jgi:hypothetical protein